MKVMLFFTFLPRTEPLKIWHCCYFFPPNIKMLPRTLQSGTGYRIFYPSLRTRTVGWSDLLHLAIFENIAANQVYFYEFNSKKSVNYVARLSF